MLRCVALGLLVFAGRAVAGQTRVMIPVPARAARGAPVVQLEAFVYRPPGRGPFPVVILSHGSVAGGDAKASLPAASLARFFVDRGMEVVVPMRRGRGHSEGVSLESEERNCEPASWEPGLGEAIDDLTGAIDYARELPAVDSTRVMLVGVSRGGFLSVAYAARGPRRQLVAGVINFVGAWVAQAEDRCSRDFNALSFRAFGRAARQPMLWLYGAADPFNAVSDVAEYVAAFREGGGQARFVLFPRVPGNGHAVADHQELWRDSASAFLRSVWRQR